MSALYAGFLRPHPTASVIVFSSRRASIGVTAEGLSMGGLSRRIDNPADLRAFALKCLAAAEVMEGASE